MRHSSDGGIMSQFMQGRAIEIDRRKKAALFGDADEVFARVIKSLFAAPLNGRAARGKETFGQRDRIGVGYRLDGLEQIVGKPVTLRDIEESKAFQKRHAARFVVAAGRCLFLLGHKAVGINGGRALLALANGTA